MTETQQLIEQVRAKLDGATNYKIAQALDLPTQRLSDYVKGDREADTYACAKIAEVLGRDTLEIIAQVEAEAARTEKKREFWRSFPSGAKRTALGVALLLTSGFFGQGSEGGAGTGTKADASRNVY